MAVVAVVHGLANDSASRRPLFVLPGDEKEIAAAAMAAQSTESIWLCSRLDSRAVRPVARLPIAVVQQECY